MTETDRTDAQDSLSIRLGKDEMQVLASGRVVPEGLEAAVQEVRGKLHGLGLASDEIQAQAIENFRKAVKAGPQLKNAVILEGRPPTPPKDGKIEWTRDFFSKGFYIDPETGAADYRRLTAEVNVGEGDLLATISAPVAGKEGRDVFGHVVPPREPKEAQLRAGRNVRCDEANRKYYAKVSGRIRCVGGVVSVDDVLTIKGSAGLATGHINHPGALVIGENVDPQTEITATGDIEVHGYVDDARIICGGTLIVHGGINGGPHGKVEVEGDVFALFLANVELDAGGDVFIQREINQSKVRARGGVDVAKGRIAGGEVCALGGIYAERIGTEAGVRTSLIVGHDYKLHAKIEARLAELERLKPKIRKIQERVDPLRSRLDKLPPRLKENIAKLLVQLKELTARRQEIQAEVESLHEESEARRKLEVYVKRELTEDVSVTINKLTLLTREPFPGPVRVAIIEGDIRVAQTRLRR